MAAVAIWLLNCNFNIKKMTHSALFFFTLHQSSNMCSFCLINHFLNKMLGVGSRSVLMPHVYVAILCFWRQKKKRWAVINKWESGKGSFWAAQRYHPITSLHIGLSEKSHWSAQSLLFSTNRYPSSQTVTKPSRSNPASTWQAWECVSLWYHTTPIDRGAIERAQ